VKGPSAAPAAGGGLGELLGTAEPPPPGGRRGGKALRILARVVLWSLIGVGALRGLVPVPGSDPDPVPAAPSDDRHAEAVAAAFMREYLTVGADAAGTGRAARAERLGRFAAAGVDLRRSVSLPAGVAQYVDHVVASGRRPVDAGLEVTVLAHVLQIRSGGYHDGGTLAFVVPMVVGRGGVAVGGRPRPATPPVASGSPIGQPRPAPAELVAAGKRVARQAVIAVVASDSAALARLGGGRPPSIRALPSGWRAVGVGVAEVSGPAERLIAQVSIQARPPLGPASYSVPVRVHLLAGRQGLTVRQIDAGGPA
jgi:hypothetical protein